MSGQPGDGRSAGATPTRAAISETCQPSSPAGSVTPPSGGGTMSRLILDSTGFDLRPDPLQANTPAGLTAALRRFRTWAGQPSFRELARRCGGTPAASTICTMLRTPELPAFGSMLAFLGACDATEEDRQRFATAWRRISLGLVGDQPDTPQLSTHRNTAGNSPDYRDW